MPARCRQRHHLAGAQPRLIEPFVEVV
jgi:hypothetical protein